MRGFLDSHNERLPCPVTLADYHFWLCSLQLGIWEAASEAHSCKPDGLVTQSAPRDLVQMWDGHLDLWRAKVESDCQLRQDYFSSVKADADHTFYSLSLMLWHISALSIHAPLKLLQGQGCCFNCRPGSAVASRKNTARLRTWVTSLNARTAVWNAAQISRVVAQESSNPETKKRLPLNPLAIPWMVKSAVVVCSYAYCTRACPLCTGGPPIDLIDVLYMPDDDEDLKKWKENGEGLATWGIGGNPICRCRLSAFAAWFRGALAVDSGAEMEFTTFLGRLGKL